VKSNIGKVSPAVAVVLCIFGSMVLCACPEIFALAAAFAGIATWTNSGRIRRWSIVVLIAAIIFTIADSFSD
jgi:hypothetical protein